MIFLVIQPPHFWYMLQLIVVWLEGLFTLQSLVQIYHMLSTFYLNFCPPLDSAILMLLLKWFVILSILLAKVFYFL